jgi:hypothetical protein
MSKQRIIDLGGLPQHAVPAGLSFQFLDGDGNPADMSSGTWTGEAKGEQLHVAAQPSPGIGTGTVAVDSGDSTGAYTWDPDDFLTVGRFQLVIWAGNGVNRYGSPTFEWEVYDAPGDTPTV